MYSLVLTLGHNSSAILIEDGNILVGYEEERLSRVKSDSRFPYKALEEIQTHYFLPSDIDIFISHWFMPGKMPSENSKYWDLEYISTRWPNCILHFVDMSFTHHDAHLLSAQAFVKNTDWPDKYSAVIADGFGTAGECISIYDCSRMQRTLKFRVRGYNNSLGLLYQYATAYCGMKMHNHEYKMLAYETHILEVTTEEERAEIDRMAKEDVRGLINFSIMKRYDPFTNEKALENTQLAMGDLFDSVMDVVEKQDDYATKVVIAYFVQSAVQNIMLKLVKDHCGDNVLVAGGLFYNVKLNHLIANQIKGKFCAMPLAGDQGAGLGVYENYRGDLKWPGHLFWGVRNLQKPKDIVIPGLHFVSEREAGPLIKRILIEEGFVNLVRGNIEFGPRALCNTSTLGLPNEKVAAAINHVNDRTNEMPFAPVMTVEQALQNLKDVSKIYLSLNYMIATRQFKGEITTENKGMVHYYPLDNAYTSRVQITDDPLMTDLLEYFGPLINTSFNFHGVPIAFDMSQIIECHLFQQHRAKHHTIHTVIISENS